MLVYNAEWKAGRGTRLLDLQLPGEAVIQVSSVKPVTLQALRDGSWVPLHTGTTFKVSAKFESFEKARLVGTGQSEYGYRCHLMVRQNGEPLDDADPPAPPMPGEGANMLLKIRAMMREEFKRNRTPILEPEDLPFANRYEVEWDDERFEEDLLSSPAGNNGAEPLQSRSEPSSDASAPEAHGGSSDPELPAHAAE